MITLKCGCEYKGQPPDFGDDALLAVAFWCPNGHEGMQGWGGTWPEPPPPDRLRTTLVATEPGGGREVRYEAPGDRVLAAIGRRKDDTLAILATGSAYDSVKSRAGRVWRKAGGRAVYPLGWTIVKASPVAATEGD